MRKILFLLMLILALLLSFAIPEMAYASGRPSGARPTTSHPHQNQPLSFLDVQCLPTDVTLNDILYSPTGNADTSDASHCTATDAGFLYIPLPGGNVAFWAPHTLSGHIGVCKIEAWFPYGNLSSDTRIRYDFWYGTKWLAWPGADINQLTAPAGWNTLVSSLPVNASPGFNLQVTAHDDGGSGNIAFAAIRFMCSN